MMISLVNKMLWGDWKSPQIQISPVNLKRDDIRMIGNALMVSPNDRNTNITREPRVLDGVLEFSCNDSTMSAEKSMDLFRKLSFIAAGCSVGFEGFARKYSGNFPSAYFKMVFRIGSVVGLAFALCRSWGAYSHKKEIERQKGTGIRQEATRVANERDEFYKTKGSSALTTQILHPCEGVFWARDRDKLFAEWLLGDSADVSPSLKINAFLNTPPFNDPNSISKKILDRCVESPLQKYHEFSQALKAKREALFIKEKEIEAYGSECMARTRAWVHKIDNAAKPLMEGLSDEQLGIYEHYLDLAYEGLIPEDYRVSKANIEQQLYERVKLFKMGMSRYYAGGFVQFLLPTLDDVKLNLPPLKDLKMLISDALWKERALKAQPTKGTQEEYQQFIHALSAKL